MFNSFFLLLYSIHLWPYHGPYYHLILPVPLATTSCPIMPPVFLVSCSRSVNYHFNNSVIHTPKCTAFLQTLTREQLTCSSFLTLYLCCWGLLGSHPNMKCNTSRDYGLLRRIPVILCVSERYQILPSCLRCFPHRIPSHSCLMRGKKTKTAWHVRSLKITTPP